MSRSGQTAKEVLAGNLLAAEQVVAEMKGPTGVPPNQWLWASLVLICVKVLCMAVLMAGTKNPD